MPIPKEFDCNEVRLNQSEIETFKTAILNLSGIAKNNEPYDVSKEVRKRIPVREARNFSKAETDSIYAQEHEKAVARDEKFLADNKAACKNGLVALKTLPDGRDPKSMFMWVKQFPELLSRNNVNLAFDRYGKELSLNEDDRQTLNKNFELAKSWYSLFSSPNYFNKLYGIPGSEEYYHDLAENFLKKFQAKADELNIPARDEERIAEETGAFDAPENPAEEEEIKIEAPKEPLIEGEIPKAAPKKEAPAEKEKIKPYEITKEICLSEETTYNFTRKIKREWEENRSLQQKIQDDIHYKKNAFSAEDDASKDSVRRFHQLYGNTIKEELKVMLAGPEKHTPESALEWTLKFPHVMAAYRITPSSMKGFEEFSKEHMDLAERWWSFFQDDRSRRNSFSTVANSYRVKELAHFSETLYDKTWKAIHRNEKVKIDSLVEKLENAKTFYNSDEYKQIISLSKMLYHADELPQKFKEQVYPDTPEARHAFKLTSIKAQIDAYIDHKAKDGVKPNVYHKLAAVEELNRYVCEELNRVGVKNIPANAPKSFEGDYAPTCLAEEKGDMAMKNYLPNENMAGAEKEECARALDCMGRILVHAENLDVGLDNIYDLKSMANAFQGGPNVDLEAPQEEPEVKLMDDSPEYGADLLS